MDLERRQIINVSGVLIHEGKMLLVGKEEKFSLPGGEVEFGEQPQEALMRIYQEITGLVVEPFVPFRTWAEIETDGITHRVHIIYLVELTDHEDANAILGEDYEVEKWLESGEESIVLDEEDEELATSIKMAFELYEDWNKNLN